MDISDVVDQKVLRPASDLKPIPVEKETEFREGFLIEREPEVLTRGHVSEQVENLRIQKIAERAEFSDYGPLLPTNRRFPVMVRIAGYVIAFITKCRDRADKRRNITRGWTGPLLKEASIWFTAFLEDLALEMSLTLALSLMEIHHSWLEILFTHFQ